MPMTVPYEFIEERTLTVTLTRRGWRVAEIKDNPELRKTYNLPASVECRTIFDEDVQAKILDALGIDYK